MMDKSLEFMNIIMKINADEVSKTVSPILPTGFSFRFYKEGDIKYWSKIQTSILEFDTEHDAYIFFKSAYMRFESKLKERCIFVCNPEGMPIATAIVWYADSELGHQASLHWVAVCPEYEELGIGKAIIRKALKIFHVLEPKNDVWMHTQTWSHTAIMVYHSLGFNIVKTDRLANQNTLFRHLKVYPNDFPEYIKILKKVIDDVDVINLVETAV